MRVSIEGILMRFWLCLVCVGVFGSVCVPISAEGIQLTDVTSETGISFRHTDGASGKRYIVETVASGLALFDYDNDGDVDIYFLNGAPLKGSKVATVPRNALYRNDGNWRFTDVTGEAGVGDTGYGLGVTTADYDNDGDQDIYLSNYGANILYRNNGDGTFSDVSLAAGVKCDEPAKVGAGCAFLDIEGDGDLDLYVSNYFGFTFDKHIMGKKGGYRVYAGPRLYKPIPDSLFRNNGDGTFTDITKQSGIGDHARWGMGMVCFDYDVDGDTDIFIANDVSENFLFQNDGKGVFEEVGLMTGVAFDAHGDEQGSMGVSCGDYDNDGLLDLFVTTYQTQMNTLYKNLGEGFFEDMTSSSRAATGTVPYVSWGSGLFDLDHDGDRDLLVANGHLMDNVELFDDMSTYHQRNSLYMNIGGGKFEDVTAQSGDGMQVKISSRGVGFDDLDNDGDIDVVIVNARQVPTILRNDSPSKGHWIQLKLQGDKTNRDGIGAKVTVTAGNLKLVDEVHSGRGYQSDYGRRLHFGLGSHAKVDRIEVRWIGGGSDVWTDVKADQILLLAEGDTKTK
jgi:hypothetical protein